MERVNEKQECFEEKLKYYTLLKQKNQEYINSLNNIKRTLESFRSLTPQRFIILCIGLITNMRPRINLKGFLSLVKLFPFIETIVEMKFESVMDRNNNNDYEWGFSIRKDYAEAFNIPLNNKVKYVSTRESVYTVICAGDKGSFSLKLLSEAIEFIENSGYELAGDVIGNLLARVHEPSEYCRYIEVWLPIKKKVIFF